MSGILEFSRRLEEDNNIKQFLTVRPLKFGGGHFCKYSSKWSYKKLLLTTQRYVSFQNFLKLILNCVHTQTPPIRFSCIALRTVKF